MWGTIFENEISAIISGFAVMQFAALGSGHILSRKATNIFVSFIFRLAPTAYGLELNLRSIMSKNPSQDFLLGMFNINHGEEYCMKFLIYQGIVFLILGWLIIWYKSVYVY